MAKIHVVIPARKQSERLPGKPLADIGGTPMVVHVCRLATQANVDDVTVATDDSAIMHAVKKAGHHGAMTSAAHTSGTDRIFEVAKDRDWDDDDIVVNVQGDEPLLPSELIDQVATLLEHAGTDMATLATPLDARVQFTDLNVVKVVCRDDGRALYFSRSPIPLDREQVSVPPGKARRHIGIYAYRVRALRALTAASPAEIEVQERLEQLRALALGMEIAVADACEVPPAGVDTVDDLARVRRIFVA